MMGFFDSRCQGRLFSFGYVDDIALMMIASDVDETQRLMSLAMKHVLAWMGDHSLSLATEKIENFLIPRQKIHCILQFKVNQEVIQTKPSVSYLRVNHFNFQVQISSMAEKVVVRLKADTKSSFQLPTL